MVKFDRALFAGKLLSEASMEIMLKDERGYCCGLMKQQDGYAHSGSSYTCNTDNRIIESEEFGHIYIIKLERELPLADTNPYVVPIVGIIVLFGFLLVSGTRSQRRCQKQNSGNI